MDHIERTDGRVYYRIEGRGHEETLVLLHGLSADSGMFQPQIDFFKDRYQVIAPDLRGNGQSSQLTCQADQVLDIQAADVLAILEKEDIRQAIIGGTSYGGILTMHLMTQNPQIFKGAFLCDTFCATDLSPMMNRLAQLTAPLVKYSWFMKLSTLPIYKRWPLARSYFVDLFDRIRPKESVLQRRAIEAIDYRAALDKCKIPTLLLAGDFSGKLVQMMKTTKEHLSHAQDLVIADSFDPSNLCQPAKFNALVEDFAEQIFERTPDTSNPVD